jgi:hypothetical protein
MEWNPLEKRTTWKLQLKILAKFWCHCDLKHVLYNFSDHLEVLNSFLIHVQGFHIMIFNTKCHLRAGLNFMPT